MIHKEFLGSAMLSDMALPAAQNADSLG